MKTETTELITFGNLNRIPVDEITPTAVVRAADYAHERLVELRKGTEGRPWPCILARIERETAELAAFIGRFDALLAKSHFATGAKPADDDDTGRF